MSNRRSHPATCRSSVRRCLDPSTECQGQPRGKLSRFESHCAPCLRRGRTSTGGRPSSVHILERCCPRRERFQCTLRLPGQRQGNDEPPPPPPTYPRVQHTPVSGRAGTNGCVCRWALPKGGRPEPRQEP